MLLCKRILQYADKTIKRIHQTNNIQVQKLYQKYPFQEFGESCFKILRKKFAIYQNNYIYDECYSVGMKAYLVLPTDGNISENLKESSIE